MIGIINYRIGNLQNLKNAFSVQNIPNQIFDSSIGLDQVDKIVIPGVGAFAKCMDNLASYGFTNKIKELAVQGMPILGVCVGMQVLFSSSNENGQYLGLGLLPGQVERFTKPKKIPHTGWNQLKQLKEHPLFYKIEANSWFYFVHSYRAGISAYTYGSTDYEEEFSSLVAKDNIYGVQFHPEKSQSAGLQLIKNFNNLG